ncbi:MAG TPA: vitamin B12 dependent-methionine synthase activation domain-containing protein, partial [Rhodocyclaceae bacterium]|nr:vitamin B12 dependent-methionine synthase activation domain-containing protein [Rhodocyclaceae bacterium]
LVSLAAARANRTQLDYAPVKPQQMGITVLRDIDLATLAKYIDWGPFFQTWDLAGSYPGILDDAKVGEAARNVFHDGQAMLAQLIGEKWLTANAVFGLFAARGNGDDIDFLADDGKLLMTWHGLRQQQERPAGKPNQCLADFVAPKVSDGGTPITDYAGAFAVTAGIGIEKKLAEFEAQHDDYRAIMLKSLADRLAEAAAEWLHERVRREYWGYAAAEKLSNEELIAEKYQGIRPAPGYPACPDHTVKGDLFRLLDAPTSADMGLTESYAMTPAASVSGFYLAHPEAHYFAVGKIGRDQLEDWARRNNIDNSEAEKWLAPLL